jgi:hypothetical protein
LLPPHRKPDLLIGDDGDPCMLRWRLIPQNPVMNVYLHQMLKPDAGGVLHDHPWPSISLMLSGAATELFDTGRRSGARLISEGALIYRSAHMAHRLAPVPPDNPATWTLFVTGPSIREWGFHCPQGWRHWKAFTAARPGGSGHYGCG